MNQRPLQRLREDHRQIETLLQVLDRQYRSIGRGDRPDYALMFQALHYLTFYPDRYHHVFEDLLFERLALHDPETRPLLHALHGQHGRLTQQGSELRTLISQVLDGVLVARADIVEPGRIYVREYREHLLCEEQEVFPRLVDKLPAADWLTLTTRFAWIADPLFAGEVSNEYRLLAEQLGLMGFNPEQQTSHAQSGCAACSDAGLRLE